MRKPTRALLLLLLMPCLALAAQVRGVRLWTAPDHTRLVFDIDRPLQHKVFSLSDPDRLVIDLPKAAPGPKLKTAGISDRHVKGIRYARRKDGTLRLVLDLKQAVRPKSFLLKPNAGYGHRLVVDLYEKTAARPRVAKSERDIQQWRDVVVAIDAGHGGEDPGARGRVHRTREKDVTLQIARRLKREIDARPGMRAVLTRKGDYYVGLRKRMRLARRYKADLFISIHADAFRDPRVRGSSIYVLSNRGASSEAARWLAARENAADLVGGVSLDDKDDMLASVLLDLSQSAAQEASLAAAQKVYRNLGKLGKLHSRRIQRAGFVVLKSPDIPSMLIETGFISNPSEERKLRSPAYQKKLARAIADGVERYFRDAPPPGTLLAKREKDRRPREHVISRGETLSVIASRYRVSLAKLRTVNRIKNDRRIHVGQVLRIPET
ncbi:MAG TPA: AMIN domain-containing protein [Gammaproteobacteria bacterium]|nr:AMIN domain-containing protein [Gammaproteobacteria bacterium]